VPILDFLFVSSLASAAVFQNNNPVKIKQEKGSLDANLNSELVNIIQLENNNQQSVQSKPPIVLSARGKLVDAAQKN